VCVKEREQEYVIERERETRVWVKRDIVCVRGKLSLCVCVCVCDGERERMPPPQKGGPD